MKVRAMRNGLYDNRRRKPGQVFELKNKEDWGKWMKVVSDDATDMHPDDVKDDVYVPPGTPREEYPDFVEFIQDKPKKVSKPKVKKAVKQEVEEEI